MVRRPKFPNRVITKLILLGTTHSDLLSDHFAKHAWTARALLLKQYQAAKHHSGESFKDMEGSKQYKNNNNNKKQLIHR